MSVKLTEELEVALDRLVHERMTENYSPLDQNRLWVYEDFSNWLVKKFKQETAFDKSYTEQVNASIGCNCCKAKE